MVDANAQLESQASQSVNQVGEKARAPVDIDRPQLEDDEDVISNTRRRRQQ